MKPTPTPTLSASLAAYTEDLRARWGLSALSVSLIDGRSQAFGQPTSGPMTPHTLCSIASNTKLFTALAIGILIDQGKIPSFDTKIKDLIPGFRVENEHTTEYATLADALSHSTGCASGNIAYAFRMNDTHKDIVDNVCSTRCAKELRQSFAYDNRWYSVMAYIIEQVSGQSYSSFIKQYILDPLGMSSSTFNTKEAQSNAATPTITLDDAKTMTDLPFFFACAAPGNSWEGAAGLFSSSSDLAKWVAHLVKMSATSTDMKTNETDTVICGGDGHVPHIISKETFKQIIQPRTVSDMQMFFFGIERGQPVSSEFSTPLYGLAVERYHLHGIDVAAHTGAMPGYSSVTLWTPGRDFGIAIVANSVHRGNTVINLVAIRAFEEHFGIKHPDWEGRMMQRDVLWSTGPFKIPTLGEGYSVPAVSESELKGTYESRGNPSLLHIVGVDDDSLPANVKHLRDRLLKHEIFGRPAAELSLMAIWDTEDAYLGDFFNLIHVGENVFFGEMYKFCPAPPSSEEGGQKGVLMTTSASWGPSFRPLFYAFKNADGRIVLEHKVFWKDPVPKFTECEGDFTFVKISPFE
ncbi:beta-lactamase/transpeptidase-like protein [Cystobasidium minutum MCA 4210]|uniref:beta-lactamase/transpeptidase-like protein n=1 Tax=Cystobasidium minutum MCA 4210 TaxID=1397322 RepID=UPI0034CDC7AE|eukprot:jgi/Rhomi1/195006/gm1.3220_g